MGTSGDIYTPIRRKGLGLGDFGHLEDFGMGTHWDLVTWGLGGLWILRRNGALGFGDLQLVTLTWEWSVRLGTWGLEWGLQDW